PFIQYTHARICSILRKATVDFGPADITTALVPSAKEIRLIKLLGTFPGKVAEAGAALSPAVLANYAYDLAKEFNQYYHETPILREEDQGLLKFRLELISVMARTLRSAMGILGIELPERM
ncbi:MAG: arginine--tRNA ligase, partial [Bacteroidales bacterium]|nr:arginine--tRNA ligase [Bacteroidales bacterium]